MTLLNTLMKLCLVYNNVSFYTRQHSFEILLKEEAGAQTEKQEWQNSISLQGFLLSHSRVPRYNVSFIFFLRLDKFEWRAAQPRAAARWWNQKHLLLDSYHDQEHRVQNSIFLPRKEAWVFLILSKIPKLRKMQMLDFWENFCLAWKHI